MDGGSTWTNLVTHYAGASGGWLAKDVDLAAYTGTLVRVRFWFHSDGSINGAGDYWFMLTATDGQTAGGGGTDKFRIKIWDKDTGTAAYDNQPGASNDSAPSTGLQGGSIVVHK